MRAAQPRLQLGHSRVQRGVEVLGACLRSGDRTAPPTRDLDPLTALELASVRLVEELDLHADDLVVVPFQAGDLLGDMDPEMFRDLDVPAGDNDLHADFPRSQRRVVGVADGGGDSRSHPRALDRWILLIGASADAEHGNAHHGSATVLGTDDPGLGGNGERHSPIRHLAVRFHALFMIVTLAGALGVLCVASHSTSAPCAAHTGRGQRVAAGARVAPVVTTSSTSSTTAPSGGSRAAAPAPVPARFAARCTASRPTESRTRPASHNGRATRTSGRAAASGAAQPEHVVATAGPRRGGPGRGRHQPTSAAAGRRHRRRHQPVERHREQGRERRGEVAPAALLVAQQRGAQRAGVAPDREHLRPARQPRRGRRPEPRAARPRTTAAPGRRTPRTRRAARDRRAPPPAPGSPPAQRARRRRHRRVGERRVVHTWTAPGDGQPG